MLTLKQGEILVRYARGIIESYFKGKKPDVPEILKDAFSERRGVFVTLEEYPENRLRGCIGFSEPVMEMGKAVENSALSAALRDPRFPPLKREELDKITVEVSVLTKPELIKVNDPKEYPKNVKVGRDGLIVEKGYFKGLLLPQVPVEWKWDVEEFLSQTCMKAGLSTDEWLTKGVKIYRFSAQIFSEVEPKGNVIEKQVTQVS